MTVDTGLWFKVPKYEDVVKAIEKDYKVKLPERTALQFWDSFALSQYRDQVAELQAGEEARHDHQAMEASVQQAAEEQGLTRRELSTYLTHLQAQNSSAVQELQRQLGEQTAAHQRALQEQGTQFATQLAQESQRADRREAAARQAMQALREAPQTAPSLAPPPSQPQQVVNNYRTTHVQQIQGSDDVEQQRARDQELSVLREGQGHMGRAIGEMVRHMQSEGANVRQILGSLAQRPQVLQQIANVDARSVQQVLNLFQQYNIDARQQAVFQRSFQQANVFQGGAAAGPSQPRGSSRKALTDGQLAIEGGQAAAEDRPRAKKSKGQEVAVLPGGGPPPPPPGAGAVAIGGSSSSRPSRVPEDFYIGDDPVAHKKRKLVKLAAGLAKQIAAKMAQRGPERAFQPFQGRGRALREEAQPKTFPRKAPEPRKLPGVRKDRATKALPVVAA